MSRSDDWDRLVAIDRQLYPSTDRFTAKEYEDYHDRGNQSWLLVDQHGEWIGNVQVAPELPRPSKERGSEGVLPIIQRGDLYIGGLSVIPRLQGQGVSHYLMRKLIEEYGRARMLTRTRPTNGPANHLLRRYGFKELGHQHRRSGEWIWYERVA